MNRGAWASFLSVPNQRLLTKGKATSISEDKTMTIKTLIPKSNASILRLALLGSLALTMVFASRALAQDGHSHSTTQQQDEMSPEQQSKANALIKIVRAST